ncbi:hypothetical protein VTK73DRAFT_5879 [Phialemonium thermophilum]|uniref:SRP9 domain-containing protein n=1 Tax=Phialemonium thermophilum TaxID=223376 RepID=A0ABR3XXX5_9PEZI
MPTYKKSEDWLLQSSLLIEARPATTRITTRYSIHPARRRDRSSKEKGAPTENILGTVASDAPAPAQPPPRGELELKTYDPVSGVTLKYRTCKAAEVSRLVQMLGGPLGRRMAGLPSAPAGTAAAAAEDETLPDAPGGDSGSGVLTPIAGQQAAQQQSQQQQGAGAKGKKKKGRR